MYATDPDKEQLVEVPQYDFETYSLESEKNKQMSGAPYSLEEAPDNGATVISSEKYDDGNTTYTFKTYTLAADIPESKVSALYTFKAAEDDTQQEVTREEDLDKTETKYIVKTCTTSAATTTDTATATTAPEMKKGFKTETTTVVTYDFKTHSLEVEREVEREVENNHGSPTVYAAAAAAAAAVATAVTTEVIYTKEETGKETVAPCTKKYVMAAKETKSILDLDLRSEGRKDVVIIEKPLPEKASVSS